MPVSSRTWKGNLLERFAKVSPSKAAATTSEDAAFMNTSATLRLRIEQPPSGSFQAESAFTQRRDSCGQACRCHAGDRFPDHSRTISSSRPQNVRLLSMIQEGQTKAPPELPSPSSLSLYNTSSTASPTEGPGSRRQSLYSPSDRRPYFDDSDDYSRGRGRGRKSSESSMHRMGTYRGRSPRGRLEKSRTYDEAMA